ncbi:Predicted NAD/FAD-binding protein [Pseudooceanicola antarcticus]|uniref:Cyclopropane-fatty-acyl-phospholipid synthase n=1 Tax=Pseudooceanicola antarcticus TaxID=1247613 RepID=A0A285HM09_9RHOB|nr:FAD-dependent oxidoreductase [Pseudooceanicola antarcticus]PJE27816.1 cyclopropane-fatty-acyl-phospholipid synthase [Pseudooceanicola antarcticus]SNY36779.1 Predicted NAD/FAD-binding protein [Pseudooceanicola antarcticus]
MSFDALSHRPQRIAVIGAGISGMAAAWRLAPQHQVTLIEAAPRLGGHARTVLAGRNGDQPVDTGFIVFNYANYPHLTSMFRDLDVPVERSDMSFGATIDGGRVEYGLQTLAALTGQRRNLLRPGFGAMVRDILRFNAGAEAASEDPNLTMGELMEQMRLGRWFREFYLKPICGAIWSTPPGGIEAFPARALVRFFRNHALLSATGQHQWWTVKGGSIEYVRRLEASMRARGVTIRTGSPVGSVLRDGPTPEVVMADGERQSFDQVIFACHSDEALALLARPTAEEQGALSAVRYQDNEMVLHRDEGQMPRRRACWSSWVYKAETRQPQEAIGVTYWMNKLQNIPENDPLFVSLNPVVPVREETIYDQKTFRHPVFDGPALEAQGRIAQIQGQNGTWFAGAWLRHGFHEDGFASAVRVTRALDPQPV